MSVEVCQYYVRSRNRNCRFEVVRGTQWCAMHQPETSEACRRIPCPIDERHSVAADRRLTKHLLKCPKVRELALEALRPFYKEGCNDPSFNPQFAAGNPEREITEDYIKSQAKNKPRFYHMRDTNLLPKKRRATPFEDGESVERWCDTLDAALHAAGTSVDPQRTDTAATAFESLLTKLRNDKIKWARALDLAHKTALNKRGISSSEDWTIKELEESLNKHELQELALWAIFDLHFGAERLENAVVLELGAGRGGLCQWFVQAGDSLPDDLKPLLMLVERESRQNKKEARDAQ